MLHLHQSIHFHAGGRIQSGCLKISGNEDGHYDEMDAMELSIEEVENRLFNIKQQKISGDNVYQFLLYFDKLYDKMTDGEKKEFIKSFVEEVHLYEKEQEDGRFLKHIKFKFPVFFNETET